MHNMDVIMTAGGSPLRGDPLYEYTHGELKAMLDIAGKPMIQWVLDALSRAQTVRQVITVGLEDTRSLHCAKPMLVLPNQGSLFHNLYAGTKKLKEIHPTAQKIIALSSDIPALSGAMIDWFTQVINETDHEVYYTVITRQTMVARYPGATRSYYRLKDVEICGADLHAFDTAIITHRPKLWQDLIETRKSAFRQAAVIGLDIFLGFLTRYWTLEKVVERVSQRLGIHGRAILSPFAEMGMDVDKPSQYQLVYQDLAQRQGLSQHPRPHPPETPPIQ